MKSLPLIKLSALHRAAIDAHEWRATHVLSILDPDAKEPPIPTEVKRLVLRFHDVETGVGQGPAWVEPPLGGHVAQIIEFSRTMIPTDRALVHCHMGISRSPAAILIIASAITGSAEAAEACLQAIDPLLMTEPNSRMIQMADRQLRLRGELVAAVARLNARRGPVPANAIF